MAAGEKGILEYNLALLRAAGSGDLELAVMLVENGANVDVIAQNDYTPLKTALMRGDSSMTQFLLSKGAKVGCRPDSTDSLLHFAIARNSPAAILLASAYPQLVNVKGLSGYTPLHIAAAKGYTYLVEELVKMGANINEKTDSGATALELALSNEHGDIATFLRRAQRPRASGRNTLKRSTMGPKS